MTFDWKTFESIDTHESPSDSHEQENKLPMKRVSETVVTILNYKESGISYRNIGKEYLIYKLCHDGVIVLWKIEEPLSIPEHGNLSIRLLSSDLVDKIREPFIDQLCQDHGWESEGINFRFNTTKESTQSQEVPWVDRLAYFG